MHKPKPPQGHKLLRLTASLLLALAGVPAIDDAIRRIVLDHAPYQPFQPALARDFDVIEVRRTWQFASAIRLY